MALTNLPSYKDPDIQEAECLARAAHALYQIGRTGQADGMVQEIAGLFKDAAHDPKKKCRRMGRLRWRPSGILECMDAQGKYAEFWLPIERYEPEPAPEKARNASRQKELAKISRRAAAQACLGWLSSLQLQSMLSNKKTRPGARGLMDAITMITGLAEAYGKAQGLPDARRGITEKLRAILYKGQACGTKDAVYSAGKYGSTGPWGYGDDMWAPWPKNGGSALAWLGPDDLNVLKSRIEASEGDPQVIRSAIEGARPLQRCAWFPPGPKRLDNIWPEMLGLARPILDGALKQMPGADDGFQNSLLSRLASAIESGIYCASVAASLFQAWHVLRPVYDADPDAAALFRAMHILDDGPKPDMGLVPDIGAASVQDILQQNPSTYASAWSQDDMARFSDLTEQPLRDAVKAWLSQPEVVSAMAPRPGAYKNCSPAEKG